MYQKTIAVAFAALAAAAPASEPVDLAQRGVQTFSLAQVPVPRNISLTGAQARKNALAKYNGKIPTDVNAAAAGSVSGSVTATPQPYDEAYLCPVKIGSNSQTLMLDFDTGSSDLWVFSTEQPSSQRSGHTAYNPSSSSSAKSLSGYTWKISYGDGSGASGNVFSDKVVIGPVTATSQAVEAATSVSSTFQQDTDTDGLVGLAFSSINTVKPRQQTTFFDTVKSTLAQPLFAAYLRKGQAGSYDFGYTDANKYSGSIRYTSVDNSQGFWMINAGSIGSAIADTGTTLMLLPDSAVNSYYSKVSGAYYDNNQGGYVFPCSATLPDYSLTIGGGTSRVPGSYINYAPVDNTNCYGGIQSNSGIGFSILGDIFLKSQYAVFNSNGPSLGLAQQKGL